MIVAKTVKDEDFYEMWKAGFLYRVPLRVALMMIMQVLGILVLPWVIVGFFLGWFM
jgi:predicted transcriptional regulator